MTENEHTMTIEDVASLFGVHEDTIRQWRKRRGLPAVALSARRVRFSKREVLEWQDRQRSSSPPPTDKPADDSGG